MAEKKKAAAGPLKIVGAVLLTVGSVGFLIHRIPTKHYVEAHDDKPKPGQAPKEVVAAQKAIAKAQAAAAPAPAPAPKPAKGQPRSFTPASAQQYVAEQSPGQLEDILNWQDACVAEIGVLCNRIGVSRQPRCLRGYEPVLMRDCRRSLAGRGRAH